MDIVEFLRARLDEDETQAEHAIAGDIDYLPSITCKCGRPTYIGGDANRVLREVEAKRQIIPLHESWHVCASGIGVGRTDYAADDDILRPCPTLLALAAVYADHPDYDQEWAVA